MNIKKLFIEILLGIIIITPLFPIILKKGLCHVFSTNIFSILNSGFLSDAGSEGWASFFGSYLGGILGGVATLLALILTIKNNREEIENKANEERHNRIKKSALIVFYDFKFVLENINAFLDELRNAGVDTKVTDLNNPAAFNAYKKKRVVLDQLYFDANWIRTVADLYENELEQKKPKSYSIEPEEIKTIYEIYGHFMTIDKGIYSYDKNICNKAFEAMKKIKSKESDVIKIMNDLKMKAEIPEDTTF